MAEAHNPYAPPKAKVGAPPAREGVWRDGKLLVAFRGSPLPARCVKCNEPVAGKIKERKVYWHHPAIYLVLLVNVILYAIVAAIARKTAKVMPALCEAHRRRRRWGLLIAWAGLFIGLAIAIAGGVGDATGLLIGGILFAAISVVTGMIVSRIVWAKKIDREYVHLKGCGDGFLESLPEFSS